MTLAKLARALHFCVLAGVEFARLDGESIIGRWNAYPTRIYGAEKSRLIQDFLNWRDDPASIVAFTKRYGPLADGFNKGHAFEFPLSAWTKLQASLRTVWNDCHAGSVAPGWVIERETAGLAYEDGKLLYTAESLFTFLSIDLITCPFRRMKTCACPGCPTPFFIAHPLSQRFCSEKCAGWGQRQAKSTWWSKHGEAWRRKRRRTKRKYERNPRSVPPRRA